MISPGEFLSGELLKVKYTRRLSTEYPPELRWVPGPIESTVKYFIEEFARLRICLFCYMFCRNLAKPVIFSTVLTLLLLTTVSVQPNLLQTKS